MWTLKNILDMRIPCIGEVIVKIVFTSQKENGNQRKCGDKS